MSDDVAGAGLPPVPAGTSDPNGAEPSPVAPATAEGGDARSQSRNRNRNRNRRRRSGAGGGAGGGERSGPSGTALPRPAVDEARTEPADGEPGRAGAVVGEDAPTGAEGDAAGRRKGRRRRGGNGGKGAGGGSVAPGARVASLPEDDLEAQERRRGKERKGRPVGRYLMCVHVAEDVTQISVLEGRSLVQHVVSRPANDTTEIDGNIYLARVANVLPGMEAAFVDIGTPKNAVLYRGDVRFEKEDVEGATGKKADIRIEQVLKGGQNIICQVTKNPIAHKGARLTQEVSLPGRFVVLVPNAGDTYGISKRLPDDERRRLRRILDEIRPPGHGLIVRTAAEGCTAEELRRDLARLSAQWAEIEGRAARAKAPTLLYREPDAAVRFIREEFTRDFRGVVIDDDELYREVQAYLEQVNPELADRVERYDPSDPLPVFERFHVHEQLHKAIERKVWLPSGGSIIIERTEALTVIDVNTGKNVGSTNLEETVFRNNLEAAEEVARQLRLRDIGGIIVIDFIDMEIRENRAAVMQAFREALSRDKTRMQVYDISELGLVEMTRKRVSEGLVESLSQLCPMCQGHGRLVDTTLLT